MSSFNRFIVFFAYLLFCCGYARGYEVVQGNRVKYGSIVANIEASKWRDTVILSNFGATGSGKDETEKIQRALNASIGKTLYIPKQKQKHYLSGQLLIPSNITILFEEGVVFLAKDDLKQDIRNAESLFRFEGSENVVFDGNGATFKMNKTKYSGQFNHIIMINGAKNVTVKNVNAMDSGGDGFYIGAAWTKRVASENIRLYNCVAQYSRRQGMSVTSVNGLYVENCEFSNTRGTLPEAGVDIEPSMPNYVLNKIYFKGCVAKGNNGRGFQVVLIKSGVNSNKVDITFEDCKAIGNDIGFSNRYFAEGSKGIVRMINCTAENSKGPGFWEGSCAASGAAKEYNNCTAINNGVDLRAATVKNASGFGISNFPKRQKKVLGNSTFISCRTIDNNSKPLTDYGINLIEKTSFSGVIIKNFTSKGHTKKDIGVNSNNVSSKKISVIR